MLNIKIGSEWETFGEFPKERYYYAMVAIGLDRVAIVGGEDKHIQSPSLLCYGIYLPEHGRTTE